MKKQPVNLEEIFFLSDKEETIYRSGFKAGFSLGAAVGGFTIIAAVVMYFYFFA